MGKMRTKIKNRRSAVKVLACTIEGEITYWRKGYENK